MFKQEIFNNNQIIINIRFMTAELPLTPFDKLVPFFRRRPNIFYLSLSFFSIITSYLISFDSIENLKILLPLSIGIGIIPYFVKRGAVSLYSWKEESAEFLNIDVVEIDKFYKHIFEKFSNLLIALPASLVFMMIAIIIYFLSNAFSEFSTFKYIISWIIFLLSTFICGIGIISILHLVHFFRDLGKYPVRVTNTQFGVMMSGKKLFNCYIMGCTVWFIYSISSLGTILYSLFPLYFLSIPSLIFLIGSFLFAQYPLHKRMLEYKRNRSKGIIKLIDSLYPDSDSGVTKEKLELIESLSDLSDDISKLPEWPFNLKTIIGVLTGALGAISPALISFGLDNLNNISF